MDSLARSPDMGEITEYHERRSHRAQQHPAVERTATQGLERLVPPEPGRRNSPAIPLRPLRRAAETPLAGELRRFSVPAPFLLWRCSMATQRRTSGANGSPRGLLSCTCLVRLREATALCSRQGWTWNRQNQYQDLYRHPPRLFGIILTPFAMPLPGSVHFTWGIYLFPERKKHHDSGSKR